MAVTGAPSVERDLGLSHRQYVVYAFAIPLIIASLLEASVALASDRWDRRRLLVLGQLGLGGSLLFVSFTTSAWALSAGLALAGVCSGIACGAAQALLLVERRGDADRALVRWSLFSSIGDALAPIVTAGAIAWGSSYRRATAVIAVVVLAQAIALSFTARAPAPKAAPPDEDEPSEPLLASLRAAARRPRLWRWLFAAAICTLLDELVVAVAALRFERTTGASPATAALVTLSFSLGAVAGSALSDRAVARFGSRRVLLASALLCAVSLAATLLLTAPWAWIASLLFVAAACAPHHPLAMAQAYEEMPDRPGAVQALGQLSVIVDLAAPLAVGFVADRYGLRAAMSCLLAQPAILILCALGWTRQRSFAR